MDFSDLIRVIFALIAVLGMIGLFAIAGPQIAARLKTVTLARTPRRLQLVETLSLDTKRRVAIIRCDEREHLIILGPQSETLLDTCIVHPASVDEGSADVATPAASAPVSFASLINPKAA